MPSVNQCRCFSGLGRINGVCQVCPGGSSPNPDTEECSGCSANARLENGQCICLPGYGINIKGECIRCESVNLFLISGICGSCPSGRNWDG